MLDASDKLIGGLADLILLVEKAESNGTSWPFQLSSNGPRRERTRFTCSGSHSGRIDHELCRLEANREVGTTNDRADSSGKFAQGLVAGVVAEAFVDEAELLEIEHDKCQRMAHALRSCNFGGKSLFGKAAIVESGEGIDHRHITQSVELRLFVGNLSAQLLDEKLLANGVNVEKNDQRDESEDGFGETDFEERTGTLMGGHCSERDDRADQKHADENRIAAQRRVAFLDQRQFAL